MSFARRRKTADTVLEEVWPGQSKPLLRALGILTKENTLNADSRRKLKQVLHLVETIRSPIEKLLADDKTCCVADMGAGKSYLGLILYDLVLSDKPSSSLMAIEARKDLTQKAEAIAKQSGFERTQFLNQRIDEAVLDKKVDVVTALHACDTATDDAIAFALKHDARVIALVPCCQAEVARLLAKLDHKTLLPLWRHPIQRREFASSLTNTIRALYLESKGYKVRVTELTGWEHSLKNELILAERHQLSNPRAQAQLDRLLTEIPVRPALLAYDHA